MVEENHEKLLQDLITVFERGEIKYTPSQLRKMSHIRREQILQDYNQRQLDEVNEAVGDMIVIKFEEVMKNLDLIEEDSKLAKKLQDRSLFMKDVKNVVSYITPFLPFVGLLEGVLVTSTEVVERYKNKNETKNKFNHEGDPSPSPEGEKHSEAPEEESEHDE